MIFIYPRNICYTYVKRYLQKYLLVRLENIKSTKNIK